MLSRHLRRHCFSRPADASSDSPQLSGYCSSVKAENQVIKSWVSVPNVSSTTTCSINMLALTHGFHGVSTLRLWKHVPLPAVSSPQPLLKAGAEPRTRSVAAALQTARAVSRPRDGPEPRPATRREEDAYERYSTVHRSVYLNTCNTHTTPSTVLALHQYSSLSIYLILTTLSFMTTLNFHENTQF